MGLSILNFASVAAPTRDGSHGLSLSPSAHSDSVSVSSSQGIDPGASGGAVTESFDAIIGKQSICATSPYTQRDRACARAASRRGAGARPARGLSCVSGVAGGARLMVAFGFGEIW